MTKHSATRTVSRRRLTIPAVAAGVVGSVAIAASMGASLSGLTATINNTTNTSTSATLAVTETSGAATCRSYETTATCDTINKYGGTTLKPGESKSTTVTFTNNGTAAVGSATLTPSACTSSSTGGAGSTTPPASNTAAGNLCSVMQVALYKGTDNTGTSIYSGTLANFTSAPAAKDLSTTMAAASAAGAGGGTQAFTFVVTLPLAATTAVQGQTVSQPLLWTFNQ